MLLSELCMDAKVPVRSRNGRPRIMTDLREAQAKGFILKTPHFNTIFNYLEDKHHTPILRELITRSSFLLNAVETDFALDSSGFSTSRFVRWFDHKYGVACQEHDWVKVHLMCSVCARTSSLPLKSATGMQPIQNHFLTRWT